MSCPTVPLAMGKPGRRAKEGATLVPQKLSRFPLPLPPPCHPLPKLYLGTTSLPDLEKLEGEVNPGVTRGLSTPPPNGGQRQEVDWAEQAWGRVGITLALLRGSTPLVFPPQSAMLVHVYICICDFGFMFCRWVPEMFKASWGGAWPTHYA